MASLAADVRFAFRSLRKNPAFAAISLAVLALGMGANTAIFTVVDAVLLRPLPYPESDRLVMVWEDAIDAGFRRNTPAPANYLDWKKQNTVFEEMAAIRNNAMSLTGSGDPEILRVAGATPSLFRVLRTNAALGRTLADDDDRPGAPKVAVVGHGLWVRRFAADPGIVGRQIVLNDEKYTVVGVMPRGFGFPRAEVQLYVPTGFDAKAWAWRQRHFLNVVARLKPGATLERAQAEMKTIARRLEQQYPESNTRIGSVVEPPRQQYTGAVKTGLWILLAAVGFVLLIACANLANLLLARATSRAREMAVRAAVGAGRGQIIRQLLTESALLALGGAVLGTALAAAGLEALDRLVPETMTGAVALKLDLRVLLFTAGVATLSSVLFGLAPAWTASRVDLHEALKQGGRAVTGRRSRLRDALVIGEVALAMVLLAGAGLLIRTLGNLRGVDLGFRPDNVLTLATPLFSARYAKDPDRLLFVDRVLERVRSLPGVTAVSYASDLPLVMKGNTRGFIREGYPAPRPGEILDANYREIDSAYLQTMGVRLVRGRHLSPSDRDGSTRVAVINEATARAFWPGRDPIGRRFKFGDGEPWFEIVGVVGDMLQMGIDVPARAEMYLPLRQVERPEPNFMVVRSASDPTALVQAVVREVHAIDPQQPVARIRSLESIVDAELSQRETQKTVLAGFAALALLLAGIGIYGVLSFAVSQRTPEIGVRMALGADAANVLRMVAGKGAQLALAGAALGTTGALALTRLLSGILFGVRANDPATFAVAVTAVIGISLAAALVPALRASRLDPLIALRRE